MTQTKIEAVLRQHAWTIEERASGRAVAFGVAPHDNGTFLVFCVPDDTHGGTVSVRDGAGVQYAATRGLCRADVSDGLNMRRGGDTGLARDEAAIGCPKHVQHADDSWNSAEGRH